MTTIVRLAGTTGTAGCTGDKGPATSAEFNTPTGLAVSADGALLIADTQNHLIRMIAPDRIVTSIAGTATVAGWRGDDGLATAACLSSPCALAVTHDGSVLIADTGNHVIRKIATDGIITRIAGTTNTPGSGGDDGPAVDAQLSHPCGLALTNDGGYLIADSGNHVIRKVEADGTIRRVAGQTKVSGDTGDGGPSWEAELNTPTGVAVTPDDGFLIADTGNTVIRKVASGPDQTITKVAGAGNQAPPPGPNGPLGTPLKGPTSIAVISATDFLIADLANNNTWHVAGDKITILAGDPKGAGGYIGDDGPPDHALLQSPFGIAVDTDGAYLISDSGNQVVRRII